MSLPISNSFNLKAYLSAT